MLGIACCSPYRSLYHVEFGDVGLVPFLNLQSPGNISTCTFLV